MQKKFLALAVAIALLVAVVGCSKATSSPAVPEVVQSDLSGDIVGNINDLNAVDEEVQVEEIDVNPDELSGLDF